jgi:hypothetical protein
MQELAPIRNGRDSFGRFVVGNKFTEEIGRPPLWEYPELMAQSFGEYLDYVNENPLTEIQFNGSKAVKCEVPKLRCTTLFGFCRFCNTIPNVFYEREKIDGFRDICSYIRVYCSGLNIEAASAGLMHPIIISRIEGLVDRKEIKTENVQTVFFEVPMQNKLESPTDELKEGEDWNLI